MAEASLSKENIFYIILYATLSGMHMGSIISFWLSKEVVQTLNLCILGERFVPVWILLCVFF